MKKTSNYVCLTIVSSLEDMRDLVLTYKRSGLTKMSA